MAKGKDGLTPKQKKFIEKYLSCKNATQAYMAAGYKPKNAEVAAVLASRLLTKDNIKEQVEKRQERLIKNSKTSPEKVMEEIASIAFDDISNYLDFRTEKTAVGHNKETGEPIIDYAPIVELKDSKKISTKNVKEISIGRGGQLKLKTYDRDTALYKLAELMGLDELKKKRQQLDEDKFSEEKKSNELKNF